MKPKVGLSWPVARKAALERDRGRCVIRLPGCEGWACHVHHKNRRRGSDPHRLEFLVSCCLSCHEHVHSHPAEAYAAGWLIRSSAVSRVLFTRRSEAS